ncbi:MAG: riboflavin biosynthesis protein RibF [Defluviitaleaceae bacterium]|nr:riboflavin biosynthesis protein RibF [Defluviitaleaceae bacterium]
MEIKPVSEVTKPTALTIGKFESLHIGHQKLINAVVNRGNETELASAALTFEPNPVRVLKDPAYKTVLTAAEKAAVFDKMGLRLLINMEFSKEAANMPPGEFMDIVFGRLNCRFLAVGEAFRFGGRRAGDAWTLKREGERRGAEVDVFLNVTVEGLEISTTRVRDAIGAYDFRTAEKLLGFPYFVSGEVVHGFKLGRTIGFPTINMFPPEDKLLPANGVYLTKTRLGAGYFGGVTNVGVKDMGAGAARCVETYLFDFGGDAYGQAAEVDFYVRIRDEIKFGTLDELREQIGKDAERAREMLRNTLL